MVVAVVMVEVGVVCTCMASCSTASGLRSRDLRYFLPYLMYCRVSTESVLHLSSISFFASSTAFLTEEERLKSSLTTSSMEGSLKASCCFLSLYISSKSLNTATPSPQECSKLMAE